MITDQHREEQLSRAYVHAVAAHAGLIFEPSATDYGVDGTIRMVLRVRNGRHLTCGHSLDVQLKATTTWALTDNELIYDLEAKTYNDLVDRFNDIRATPMILVLLCLPSNEEEWLQISADELIMRRCCYWCCVGGERTENAATQRIRIPQANILDRSTIALLLEKVKNGEPLA